MGFVHARNGLFCAQLNMKCPYQIYFFLPTYGHFVEEGTNVRCLIVLNKQKIII